MKRQEAEHLRDAMLAEMAEPAFGVDAGATRPDIAVGISESNGSFRLAVRVPRLDAVDAFWIERMRETADGEIEIRETGPIIGLQLWRHQRHRPLLIGASCSNQGVSSGTLGCFVRRNGDNNSLFILSNNHVLVDDNAVDATGLPNAGSQRAVQQPSPDDFAGVAGVAQLVRAVRLRLANNVVDAAIARVTELNPAPNRTTITGFAHPLSGMTAASVPNQIVHKIGRSTELRTGRVSAQGLKNLTVTIDGVSRGFDQQIEIESTGDNFSEPGDSGSIVFDSEGRAVGLLFGGSTDNRLAYANPIASVLSLLQITIAT